MVWFLFSRKVKENLRESGEVVEGREGRTVRWEVVEESAAERRDMFLFRGLLSLVLSLFQASTNLWFLKLTLVFCLYGVNFNKNVFFYQ